MTVGTTASKGQTAAIMRRPAGPTTTSTVPATDRTLALFQPHRRPASARIENGWLDLLGEEDATGPHPGQRLMLSNLLPRIYEQLWRPLGARLLMGAAGPDMREEHRIALDMLALRPGESVLDVGCGPGNFTRRFAVAVEDGLVVGIDASATMLAQAVRETDRRNVAYVRGDACALPFRDGTFDAICCFAALYLIDEPMSALDEIARVLAPGGRLALLSSCNRGPLPAWVADAVVRRITGVRIFARDELDGGATGSGPVRHPAARHRRRAVPLGPQAQGPRGRRSADAPNRLIASDADHMTTTQAKRNKIPRDLENDYTFEAAAARRAFLSEQTGVSLEHVSQYSFDPSILPGNVEHFTGVAQVPIGVAGPLLVDGEHAQGEFHVPLATAEGTLVASYNRGMKILREAGGVKTTITDDAMQRAPAFVFEDARKARAFGEWVTEHFAEIERAAESTTRSGVLRRIEQYSASRILFTRFDYTTGDAAGQNLTSKATAAACAWIMSNYEGISNFYLESNFATDKKSSQVNILHTRGKRVVAEATLPAALIEKHMHTTSEKLFRARQVANLGGFMSGVNNNGQHSANGIAALFIATGQDAANVAESSAALNFSEPLANDDYYVSITLPSLIVATYGGGTGLATQRECLELLGCYGEGKVGKLAEIVAATVLCGELSLGWAIVAEEWVEAHDHYGRNRP